MMTMISPFENLVSAVPEVSVVKTKHNIIDLFSAV